MYPFAPVGEDHSDISAGSLDVINTATGTFSHQCLGQSGSVGAGGGRREGGVPRMVDDTAAATGGAAGQLATRSKLSRPILPAS